MKTNITDIKDVYEKKHRDMKPSKQYLDLATVHFFEENLEKAVPRMLEKRVAKLMIYLIQQKAEGNFVNALSESKSEIEQILTLSNAFDNDPDFAKQLDPKIRNAIYRLGIEYNMHGHLW